MAQNLFQSRERLFSPFRETKQSLRFFYIASASSTHSLTKARKRHFKSQMESPLYEDYSSHKPFADAFLKEFLHQFEALVRSAEIKLGVPLEGRVKEWDSIAEKLERKSIEINACKELPDLIGVRAIALFNRDVTKLCKLIEKTFLISMSQDKINDLESSKFGYLSKHYNISLPKSWKKMPSFGNRDFTVELQVRTLSQHIWATSSHILQYKKEEDVPRSVSRSIHRVAALLETVDLEFERVLDERDTYSKSSKATGETTTLNADNIAIALKKLLPKENLGTDEIYSELVSNLAEFKITTVGDLTKLIQKHFQAIMKREEERSQGLNKLIPRRTKEKADRAARGVFFTHVGMTRLALREEFGNRFDSYLSGRSKATRKS